MTPDLIYTAAREHLGDHLTLDPNIPEEVGCAEAVSTILKAAGCKMPPLGEPSVLGLISWLLANGFQEIPYPITGAVITAHNLNNGIANGSHTGICLKYGIGSNNSWTGRFTENYSFIGWENYFGNLGSTTRYFVPAAISTAGSCAPSPEVHN